MTRKEATQYFPTQTLINKIFDDFEKELLAIKDRVCEWVKNDEYEDGNVWGTDCKMDWHIPDNDTPKDHYMKYCPRCGGKIKIIKGEKEDV